MSKEETGSNGSFLVQEARCPVRMTFVATMPNQDGFERARTTVPMTPVQTQNTAPSIPTQTQPQVPLNNSSLKKD